jgi:hypothetical protein
MKYTTFRNLAIVTGAILVGGAAYTCGHRSAEPRALPPPPISSAEAPPTAALPPPALPARPSASPDYRAYLLETLGKPAKGDKIKDALHGPAKVNVYAEKGRWARAKVDLNRNEKWEEKWRLDGTKIVRQVAPDDDENYGAETQEGTIAP